MARANTSEKTKTLVWVRAAGHSELCGRDLTIELVSLANIWDGETARTATRRQHRTRSDLKPHAGIFCRLSIGT